MQSRWRSKTSWVAFFALVTFVVKTYLKVEIPAIDELFNLILALLAALGVFNNPTDSEHF